MSAPCLLAVSLLALASSGCLSGGPAGRTPPRAPGQRAAAVCAHDEECAPHFSCTSDHHCRCQFDEDCAEANACRAGLCLPR